MAALTDLSDVINRMTGGSSGAPENLFWHKSSRSGGVAASAPSAGRTISLWRYDGSYGNGATPTTAAIPTRATQGALPFTAPAAGKEKWLLQTWAACNTSGTLLVYDRLMHRGGLSGTTTGDQTVQGSPASPAITRNIGGVGNMIFVEIYTAIGGTATTITTTYTNQDGNTATAPPSTIGGTGFREIYRFFPLPLAAGDTGVRAIEKISLLASTAAAGDFGITLARPIAYLPLGSSNAGWRDFTTGAPGIPAVDENACLAFAWIPNGATAPEMLGGFGFVEK